jgi:methyltransferase (TIGR00027 family)
LRAAESQRDDRLFDDPLAAAFVDPSGGMQPPESPTDGLDVRPILKPYVAIRTRFFDDALLEAAAAGIRQVVILGARLDARAFRLTWPAGTRLFELDMPDLFAFKESVIAERGLTPACERVVIPIDLLDDWPKALETRALISKQPSAWLLEGLLMYLDEADRHPLFACMGVLALPGSRVSLEPRPGR